MNYQGIPIERRNNFILIRLFSALQVCFVHTIWHLKLDIPITQLQYFPGVLIFFTTSGFLVFQSISRNPNLKVYFRNRILRIYPALWCCLLLTLILLVSFEIITVRNIFSGNMIKWIIAQMTFFQFWTPPMLRNWGAGTPNGSLWTIPVELQFYLLLPALVILLTRIKVIYKVWVLTFFSILCNLYVSDLDLNSNYHVFPKIIKLTLLPYLLYFNIGIIMNYYWSKIKKLIEGKALWWFIIFIVFAFVFKVTPDYFPESLSGFMINIILSILTLSFAYTNHSLSAFLKGQDYSYGIYIYHMLVINCFIQVGLLKSTYYLWLSVLFTFILAFFSWNFIEKIALRKKRYKIKEELSN